MDKAADLAGIDNYDFVNVNTEVLRRLVEESREIFGQLQSDQEGQDFPDLVDVRKFSNLLNDDEAGVPVDLPMDLTMPKFYYIYVVPRE